MGGRICGPVNFGPIKITKEKAVGAVREHKKMVVSVGGVLGLRYARTSTVESVLYKSSHAMRFITRGREWGWVVINKFNLI